jgi:hypothetical protein
VRPSGLCSMLYVVVDTIIYPPEFWTHFRDASKEI